MKTLALLFGLSIYLASPAVAVADDGDQNPRETRGQETGHGGASCDQSVAEMTTALKASLRKQGGENYPEFELSTFDFFFRKATITLVPQTFVGGEETDAKSEPDKKAIYLSRAKWCSLPELRKQSILFHEYLVLMEIEVTGDYHVSKRYSALANQTKWACASAAYTGYSSGTLFPSPTRIFKTYYGSTSEMAFDLLLDDVKATNENITGLKWFLCNRIGRNDGYGYAFCAEEATPSNSCLYQN